MSVEADEIPTSSDSSDLFLNRMTVQDFKMMSVEALRVYLDLRKKSSEGDFETLVYRFVFLITFNLIIKSFLEHHNKIFLSVFFYCSFSVVNFFIVFLIKKESISSID